MRFTLVDTMRDRSTLERIALFALGVASVYASGWLSAGLAGPVGLLAALAVVAGLVEAGGVRRTGRHHRLLSWLPAVLGMAAVAAFKIATGPRGPDSGVADGIVLAALAVGIPVFAGLVLGVAWAALRVRPPAPR